MDEPKVSLIIVSRDRPEGLRRILCSLQFQYYRNFEVIVVSNADIEFSKQIKFIRFEGMNISAARNLGIQASSGDLIAFCDDDAVPEPTWLMKLVKPFEDRDVGIAGGFVRGRNGIDFQWKAQEVNQFGVDRPIPLADETMSQVFGVNGEWRPRVQGTNCIFRKSVLVNIGGFDENFKFYLDETDVCYRASKMGWMTAFVPDAEVQHGFEESASRTKDRVPKSLFTVGKSKAYYCNKHSNGHSLKDVLNAFRGEQRNRLIGLMASGSLDPLDVNRLLITLEQGLDAGQKVDLNTKGPKEVISMNNDPFLQMNSIGTEGEVFAGSQHSKASLINAALAASQLGKAATVFCWSYTTLFHKRYFDVRGFWVQIGGLFGKSQRSTPYFRAATLTSRTKDEAQFIQSLRKITKISVFRFNKIIQVIK